MYHIIFHISSILLLLNHVKSRDVFLSCGSIKGGEDNEKQKWEPDGRYVMAPDKSIQSKASHKDPSLLSDVPYMNARVFIASGSYQITIKPRTRYFVRFHFYPESYDALDISNSYFSVVANGITLLNNFSASLTCQAYAQAYVVKEYSLLSSDNFVLNLTFIPSDKHQDSFGFVNGIEVIQMPELFGVAPVVGLKDNSIDAKIMNLQTMFRLNVGGRNIPTSQDAGGLRRTWVQDDPYIFGSGHGITNQAENVKIQYGFLSDSAAPVDVYSTERSMGATTSENNVKTNMTWLFRIDANFTYLLRLHFCEIQYTKPNQRVFNIYMNNQSAQADPLPADIILWAGRKGVPIYKDYAIISGGNDQLWLQMMPSTVSKPEFYDVQLNGLEIFKVESSKNLAGPNPQRLTNSSGGFFNAGTIMAVVASMIVISAIGFIVYKRKKGIPGTDSHPSSWLPFYLHSMEAKSSVSGKGAGTQLSNLAQGLSRRFSLSEMKHGTKNFHESNVIGVGGFGKVYKGVIDKTVEVAIKRSNPNSEQGINEFQTEIEMLSKLRHKHLVSLIGFCDEDKEMCLIYDYMAFGTLREHLYNTKNPRLSWKQRLEILIGSARGLHYLHTGAKYTIIHRDVKTTNILLDSNMVAKVSDFGLSKTGADVNDGHVTTVVKGSFGYLDPEYFRRQQLTEKSDVYSFGVVLFEVLCARPALDPSVPKEQVNLADWALNCKRKGKLEDILDPHIKGKMDPECFKKVADTAEKCLADQGQDRPSMGDVLWNLEFALQLQVSIDTGSEHRMSSKNSQKSNISDQESSLLENQKNKNRLSNLSLGSDHELSDE